MSIKVTAWVWKHSKQRGTLKLLMLAFAEHANDQGICWPAISRLAGYIGETERHTRRLIKDLVEAGEIIRVSGGGRGNITHYGVAVGLNAKQREKLNDALQNTVLQDIVSENSDIENSDVQNTVTEETVTSGVINSDIWGAETVTSGHAEKEPISAPQPAKQPQKNGGNRHGTVIEPEEHVVRRRASAPDEPPTPKEIREAVASVSSIDLKAGLQADIIQVNKTAKHLWKHMRQPDQTADSLATEVRGNGRWIRQSQHPYKGSEQRIPPSALIKFWPAAMAALQTRASPTNGTNGHHPPPVVIPPEDLATADDFAALFQGLNGIGKAHDSTSTDTTPQPGGRKRFDRGPGHKP